MDHPSPRDSHYRRHSPGDTVAVSRLGPSWPGEQGSRAVGVVLGVGYCVFRRLTTYDVLVGGGVHSLLSYEVDPL